MTSRCLIPAATAGAPMIVDKWSIKLINFSFSAVINYWQLNNNPQ